MRTWSQLIVDVALGLVLLGALVLVGMSVWDSPEVSAQAAGDLPVVSRYDWDGVGVTPEMIAAFQTDPEAVAFELWGVFIADPAIQDALETAYPGQYDLLEMARAAAVHGPTEGAFRYVERRGESLGLRDTDPAFFVALSTIKSWAQRP